MTGSATRLLIVLLALTGVACTSSIATVPRHAPGGIDLAQSWPESSRRPAVEAYGVAQHVHREATANLDVDPYLKAEFADSAITAKRPLRAAKTQTVTETNKRPVDVTAQQTAVAEPLAAVNPSDQAPRSHDVTRYAARDRDSVKQQGFRGGDTIVITAGTVMLVLLILVLLLLIT